jgi:Helix-turn-helix family
VARDRFDALGLPRIDAYVWGRAAALGEPAPAVVVAAFGVFEPTFLGAAYERGRRAVERSVILDARLDVATTGLEHVLRDDREVAVLADLLLEATDDLDGVARPLFSGLRGLPTPSTAHGRLWRGAELVREHRGDGHLAVSLDQGLSGLELNVLTELWLGYPLGEYAATRGFSPDRIDAAADALVGRGWIADHSLTEEGRRARQTLEEATDRAQDVLVTRLGDRLDWAIATADRLSRQAVDAGAFPADSRKRAAG